MKSVRTCVVLLQHADRNTEENSVQPKQQEWRP